jgi:hypothetical protein
MSTSEAMAAMYSGEQAMQERRFSEAAKQFEVATQRFTDLGFDSLIIYCVTQRTACHLGAWLRGLPVTIDKEELFDLASDLIKTAIIGRKLRPHRRLAYLADSFGRLERFLSDEGCYAVAGRAHVAASLNRGLCYLRSGLAIPGEVVHMRGRPWTRVKAIPRRVMSFLGFLFRGFGSLVLYVTCGYGEYYLLWVVWAFVAAAFFGFYYWAIGAGAICLSQSMMLSVNKLTLVGATQCPSQVQAAAASVGTAEGICGYFLLAILVAMLFRRMSPS